MIAGAVKELRIENPHAFIVLEITIAPRHDGEDGGFFSSFVTAGGEEFGFGVP